MRTFTTETANNSQIILYIVDTDFTADFSGGTRRGRRVPFRIYSFLTYNNPLKSKVI